MKKNIKYIIIALIIGIILGKYTFNQYKNKSINTIKSSSEEIYLLQYGVYKNENNMKNSTKDLINYFYYKDKKGYHVLIGIIKNKKNIKKIVDSYKLTGNIYMKRVKIGNQEFIEALKQYDSLIEQTNDSSIIINAQKQILSKYEELIRSNEKWFNQRNTNSRKTKRKI